MEIPLPVDRPLINPRTQTAGTLRISNAGFAAIFELYLGKDRIGYANCSFLSSLDCLICDLRIGDEEIKRSWRTLFKRRAEHRRHGWGTLLLQAVIEEAEQTGFQTLYADVTPADLAANADLIGWYRRHGFTVSEQPAADPTWQRLQCSLVAVAPRALSVRRK